MGPKDKEDRRRVLEAQRAWLLAQAEENESGRAQAEAENAIYADHTDTEKVALHNIGEGTPVDADLCEHLKSLGLVEMKEKAWATTQLGHFELMFQRAR